MTVSDSSKKAWLFIGGSAIVLFAAAGILPSLLYSGSNGAPANPALQRPATMTAATTVPSASPSTHPADEIATEGLTLPTD